MRDDTPGKWDTLRLSKYQTNCLFCNPFCCLFCSIDWNDLKSWQHSSWSCSKVDSRPEGYLSFPHPVCRESPALAREGPLVRRSLGNERFVWLLIV